MIYLNTKFSRRKRAYTQAAEKNTNLLIVKTNQIIVKEEASATQKVGGSTWLYSDKQNNKPRTFKL